MIKNRIVQKQQPKVETLSKKKGNNKIVVTNLSYHHEKLLPQTTNYIHSHNIRRHPKELLQRKRKFIYQKSEKQLVGKEFRSLPTAT